MSSAAAFADKTVLVTGAQGFTGSWLAERLLDEGARVIVPERRVAADSRFVAEGIEARCEPVAMDLLDCDSLVAAVERQGVRALFHLAARSIVGKASRAPLRTLEVNVRGTWTLLEACRLAAEGGHRLERIVVASSDHAYGAHEQLPFREQSALQPTSPYDVSKACVDLIARSYAVSYGMPLAVTRFANTYGGGDLNWSRLVPSTVRSLLLGERPVIRSDGSPERDYLYVEDAVEAYLAVGSSLDRPELHGRAWNAGNDTPVRVIDLVRRLIARSGRDVEPDIQGKGAPHGEVERQYLDSTAIREELGFTPRYDLDRGLAETWSWYERHLG